jgi:hypothetical protein
MHIVEEILDTVHCLILVILVGDRREVSAVFYHQNLLLLVMVLFYPPITMAFLLCTPPICQQIHCPPPHPCQIQPIGIPAIGNGAFNSYFVYCSHNLVFCSNIMCSDVLLLQEDHSLSAEVTNLQLRDANRQTNRSSRLAPIQSHDMASSDPSSMNQRYCLLS